MPEHNDPFAHHPTYRKSDQAQELATQNAIAACNQALDRAERIADRLERVLTLLTQAAERKVSKGPVN